MAHGHDYRAVGPLCCLDSWRLKIVACTRQGHRMPPFGKKSRRRGEDRPSISTERTRGERHRFAPKAAEIKLEYGRPSASRWGGSPKSAQQPQIPPHPRFSTTLQPLPSPPRPAGRRRNAKMQLRRRKSPTFRDAEAATPFRLLPSPPRPARASFHADLLSTTPETTTLLKGAVAFFSNRSFNQRSHNCKKKNPKHQI